MTRPPCRGGRRGPLVGNGSNHRRPLRGPGGRVDHVVQRGAQDRARGMPGVREVDEARPDRARSFSSLTPFGVPRQSSPLRSRRTAGRGHVVELVGCAVDDDLVDVTQRSDDLDALVQWHDRRPTLDAGDDVVSDHADDEVVALQAGLDATMLRCPTWNMSKTPGT